MRPAVADSRGEVSTDETRECGHDHGSARLYERECAHVISRKSHRRSNGIVHVSGILKRSVRLCLSHRQQKERES